jgi:hypothetical protein
MDHLLPQVHQSAQEVLQEWPQTAGAFQALGTACLGCLLARFCTLGDVAATYRIPAPILVERIQLAIQESNSYPRSET